jgi:hypothetical protein
MWKLLTLDNYNWIGLVNRPLFIKNMLEQIYNQTQIKINFNCDNYKDLIPILPYVDITIIREKINSYNKKTIFFYNQNSCSGLEVNYSKNINEEIIQKLIDNYGEDHIIILSKPCIITHKNLINVETEFGIVPVVDGKNLVINANIANLCDEVYFKSNGGSFFILNKMNIIESQNKLKYHFIGTTDFYNVINDEYELKSKLY